MQSYKDILNNEVKHFVEYCKEKLNINKDIQINVVFRNKTESNRVANNLFGYVDLLEIQEKQINNIVINNSDATLQSVLSYIAHEITHIKQIINKELQISKCYKHFIWNNQKLISLNVYKNYVKTKGIEKYMQIPFENEAYNNEKELTKGYTFKSAELSMFI